MHTLKDEKRCRNWVIHGIRHFYLTLRVEKHDPTHVPYYNSTFCFNFFSKAWMCGNNSETWGHDIESSSWSSYKLIDNSKTTTIFVKCLRTQWVRMATNIFDLVKPKLVAKSYSRLKSTTTCNKGNLLVGVCPTPRATKSCGLAYRLIQVHGKG